MADNTTGTLVPFTLTNQDGSATAVPHETFLSTAANNPVKGDIVKFASGKLTTLVGGDSANAVGVALETATAADESISVALILPGGHFRVSGITSDGSTDYENYTVAAVTDFIGVAINLEEAGGAATGNMYATLVPISAIFTGGIIVDQGIDPSDQLPTRVGTVNPILRGRLDNGLFF